MSPIDPLRAQLSQMLDWEEAHVGFDRAVKDLAPALRGVRPHDFPHSAWELVEHMRLTQYDLLEFCRNAAYEAPKFPDEYWPLGVAPPASEAWDQSIEAFRKDRAALRAILENEAVDLGARISHGTGQTYLREMLLAANHAAYHVGQLVALRRLLGAWPSA